MRETSCTSPMRGSALCRRSPAETSVGGLPCGIRIPHGNYLTIWSYNILVLLLSEADTNTRVQDVVCRVCVCAATCEAVFGNARQVR